MASEAAVSCVRHIIEEYKRFLRTSYSFLDPGLNEQFENHLQSADVVIKGPYVTLARDFETGKTLADLVNEGIAHPSLVNAHWAFGDYPLFAHQERAFRISSEGDPMMVTTGTGSGKTECFLLPVIDYCLKNRGKGVKALLMYPMNALANDQLERLRRLLRDTELPITFGLYTGDSDTISSSLTEPPLEGVERITREQIRRDPPDILLTNYKQLEFLLIRSEDRHLFTKSLKYLVLDEIHSYRGALATEIACLIRRLKAHCELDPGELIGIGTSATVAEGEEGIISLAKFGSDLFGEKFKPEHIIVERYQIPDPEGVPDWTPPPADITDSELRDLSIDDSERIENLAAKLLGKPLSGTGDLTERIKAALRGNRLVLLLEDELAKPKSVQDMANKVRETFPDRKDFSLEKVEREVEAYLLLGSIGDDEHPPRLRPKLHLFCHGIYDVNICLNTECRKLIQHGSDTCPECGSRAMPAALCRTCGQDFVKVKVYEGSPQLIPDSGWVSDERFTRFLTPHVNVFADAADSSEDDEEDSEFLPGMTPPAHIDDGLEGVFICPKCARITDSKSCDNCDGDAVEYRMKKGKGHSCPACGSRVTRREIISPLRTGTASSVSMLMTPHLDRLEDDDRKLLVFADNRQDAAHQSGYSRHRQRQFVIRHLIEKYVRESEDGIGIEELPYKLLDGFKELGIIKYRPGKSVEKNWLTVLSHEVASEFCRPTHLRLSLENLGLVALSYDYLDDIAEDPDFIEICEAAGTTPDVGKDLVRALLDILRRQRAVNFTFFQEWLNLDKSPYTQLALEPFHLSIPDQVQNLKPMVYAFDRPQTLKKNFRAIVRDSGKGRMPGPQALTARALGCGLDAADRFVRDTFKLLVDEKYGLLEVPKKLPFKGIPADLKRFQVQRNMIRLVKPESGYRCPACKVWRAYEFVTCPTASCKRGMLEPEPVNRDNYYVNLYTDRPPQRLRLEEHTAQISAEVRAKRETSFKEGKLEILVCSPTLELGVDIGPLLTVVLRNAPPTPANYAQRIGRAGRRLRIGFVTTYCGAGPHDRHAFERPEWLISGLFKPPNVRLDNPRIVDRHLRSYLLELLDAQLPRLMKDFVDNIKKPQNFKDDKVELIAEEIQEREDECAQSLVTLFKQDLAEGRTTLYDENYARSILKGFRSSVKGVLDDWWAQVLRLDAEFKEFATVGSSKYDMKKAGARMRAYREITSDKRSAYTLNYLATTGLLPSYQFPTDVFSLDPGVEDTPTLRRSAIVALGEFAPGNLVYANNKKLRSIRAIYGSPKGDRFKPTDKSDLDTSGRTKQFYFCRHCDTALEQLRNSCPTCSNLIEMGTQVAFLDNFEAEEQTKITADEEARDRAYFILKESLIEKGETKCDLYKYPFAPLEHRRGADILVTNWGRQTHDSPEGERFSLCSDCGRHRRFDPIDKPKEADRWDEWHSKFCNGTIRDVVLGYEFTTDILVVSVPYPPGESPDSDVSNSFMRTLAEALLLGSALLLEVEVGEVGSFVRRKGPNSLGPQIILYESTPGGAGYLEELAKNLPQVAQSAYDRLFGHECSRSCYRCLKRYGNQRFHGLFDKESVRSVLFQLAGESSPVVETVMVNKGADALKQNLEERNREVGGTPESPIEVALLEAMRAFPGLPEPVAQFEVREEDRLVTVPDFAYPDEKIAIFCDGYQYHGDRDTLESDSSKRNYLQTQAWTVLVYWGRQILKNPDRVVREIAAIYQIRLNQ